MGVKRTDELNAGVQIFVGTVAQVERDGAGARGHPAEGQGHADRDVEAAVGDVEGVLGAGEGREGAGEKSECEAHRDDDGIVDM